MDSVILLGLASLLSSFRGWPLTAIVYSALIGRCSELLDDDMQVGKYLAEQYSVPKVYILVKAANA